MQIKTKLVNCHTADSKPVKQEVNGTETKREGGRERERMREREIKKRERKREGGRDREKEKERERCRICPE